MLGRAVTDGIKHRITRAGRERLGGAGIAMG
jgi:hypothetical protein